MKEGEVRGERARGEGGKKREETEDVVREGRERGGEGTERGGVKGGEREKEKTEEDRWKEERKGKECEGGKKGDR